MLQRLPGLRAQIRMVSTPRQMTPTQTPREAAVLILIYPRGARLHVLLTLRTERVSSHSSQISLPGGARDGREPLVRTALREAEEEVGLHDQGLWIVGGLTPLYVAVSNYRVYPFVALGQAPAMWRLETAEVAAVIEAPLDTLMDPAARQEEDWQYAGRTLHARFFRVGTHAVWGATAMILSELMWLLRPPVDPVADSIG